MAVHGVAGYAAGCRCQECVSAQRARERQIAAAERTRWGSVARAFGDGRAGSAGHQWSAAEYAVAADESLTVGQVAVITGRSVRAVNAARKRLRRDQVSVPELPKHGRRWTHAERAVAVNPALSLEQAAARLGRSAKAVHEIRRVHRARELREHATGEREDH
ncbi:hypothetical protein [Mycobacterium sp. NPDC050853]|uniref:hypothetical protein n=1 Tax=Mycobacterium sp. NPDC050853 TaxID=3155160 RepID=UPI0033EF1ED0